MCPSRETPPAREASPAADLLPHGTRWFQVTPNGFPCQGQGLSIPDVPGPRYRRSPSVAGYLHLLVRRWFWHRRLLPAGQEVDDQQHTQVILRLEMLRLETALLVQRLITTGAVTWGLRSRASRSSCPGPRTVGSPGPSRVGTRSIVRGAGRPLSRGHPAFRLVPRCLARREQADVPASYSPTS